MFEYHFASVDTDARQHQIAIIMHPHVGIAVFDGKLLLLRRTVRFFSTGMPSFAYRSDDLALDGRFSKTGLLHTLELTLNGVLISPDPSKKQGVAANPLDLAQLPLGPENELLSRTEIARQLVRLDRTPPFATCVPPRLTLLSVVLAFAAGIIVGLAVLFLRGIILGINGIAANLTLTGASLSFFSGLWAATMVFTYLRRRFIQAADQTR